MLRERGRRERETLSVFGLFRCPPDNTRDHRPQAESGLRVGHGKPCLCHAPAFPFSTLSSSVLFSHQTTAPLSTVVPSQLFFFLFISYTFLTLSFFLPETILSHFILLAFSACQPTLDCAPEKESLHKTINLFPSWGRWARKAWCVLCSRC